MKTLLTILTLFIAGRMFGQDDTTMFTLYNDFDKAIRDLNEEHAKEFEAAWTPYIQQKTVALILQYAEECYNDSVPVCRCEAAFTYMIPSDLCWTMMDSRILDSIVSLGVVGTTEYMYWYPYPCGEDTTENTEYGTVRFRSKLAHYSRKQPTFPAFIEWLRK